MSGASAGADRRTGSVGGLRDRLWATLGSTAAANVLSTGLGYLFWVIAARSLRAPVVGVGTAAIATILLVQVFGVIGTTTLVIGGIEATRQENRREYMTTCLLISGGGSLVVGAIAGGYAAFGSGTLHDILAGGWAIPLIAAGCVFNSWGTVQDAAALGLRRPSRQMWRNALQSTLRLVFLGLIVLEPRDHRGYLSLLAAWVAPCVLSVVVMDVMLKLPGGRWRPSWRLVRSQFKPAIAHQMLTISLATSILILPLVVATVASASAAAWFNVARNVASGVLLLPYLVSIALLTTTVNRQTDLSIQLKRTLRVGLGLSCLAILGTAVLGRMVLGINGPEYAQRGYTVLLVLVCAGPMLVLRDQWVMTQRVTGRMLPATARVGAATVVEVAAIVVVASHWGPVWACIAWLGCLVAEAPFVITGLRRAITGGTTTHMAGRHFRTSRDGRGETGFNAQARGRRDDEPLVRRELRRAGKRAWAAAKKPPSTRRQLFVFGCQRSGTTMLQQSLLESSRLVYTLGEHDRRIIDPGDGQKIRLRQPSEVAAAMARLPFPLVVAKPLVESHDVRSYLDAAPGAVALWMLRRPSAVARSNLARFGSQQGHRDLAGVLGGRSDWRAQVPEPVRNRVEQLTSRGLSDLDAAALFWWSRNQLYMCQRLWTDERVKVLDYDFIRFEPMAASQALADLIGMELPVERMSRRIRPSGIDGAELSPPIAELCAELYEQMADMPRLGAPKPTAEGRGTDHIEKVEGNDTIFTSRTRSVSGKAV